MPGSRSGNAAGGLISAERPTAWGEVAAFSGPGGQRLQSALAALAPITGIEHDCLLAQLRFASLARQPMRPTTHAEKAEMLAAVVGARATTTARYLRREDQRSTQRAGGLRHRAPSTTMLLELIDALGGWSQLARRAHGWLWGPAGPPREDSTAAAGSGGPDTWAQHAVELGMKVNPDAMRASDREHYEAMMRTQAFHVSGLFDSAEDAAAFLADAKNREIQAFSLLEETQWMRSEADNETLAVWAAAAHAAVEALADTARSAMRAAAYTGIARAAMSDLIDEDKALAVMEAAAWSEGLINRWNTDAPTPDPDDLLTWWSLRNPTPGEFWLAAYTTARMEAARAANDDRGVACALLGRPLIAWADASEELQALAAFERRFPHRAPGV